MTKVRLNASTDFNFCSSPFSPCAIPCAHPRCAPELQIGCWLQSNVPTKYKLMPPPVIARWCRWPSPGYNGNPPDECCSGDVYQSGKFCTSKPTLAPRLRSGRGAGNAAQSVQRSDIWVEKAPKVSIGDDPPGTQRIWQPPGSRSDPGFSYQVRSVFALNA